MSARTLEQLERDAFVAEAESIAQLLQHPAWPRYEDLLNKMRLGALELMAASRNQRAITRAQGAVAILQELIDRPHRIVEAGRGILDEEAQQGERRALDYTAGVTVGADDL